MENRSDLDIMDFTNIFQALSSSQRTGTLQVDNSDGDKKYIYFQNGNITLMALGGNEDFAAMSFLKSGYLDEEQIQSLTMMQNKTNSSLAHIALRSNLLTEDEIIEALGFQIQEEVCEIFLWDDVHCEFYANEPTSNYAEFEFLSRSVVLNSSSLLMEAARRKDEWSRIKDVIPSLKNVYKVNPDSFHFFDESDPNTEFIREILSLIDGNRDVDEICSLARMSKFDSLAILKDLVEGGEVSPMSGAEVLQIALAAQKEGNIKKALRLYERAEELGVRQYDLPDRIAKAYEALGRTRKAIEKYLDFAAKCCNQGKLDDAILTYHKVIRLDSNDIKTHEKLIGLLLEQDRKEEAVREYKLLIQKYKKFDEKDKLFEAWKAVCEHSPGVNKQAYEELAELYIEKGDTIQAIIDFDELATNFLIQERFAEAVAVYRQILDIDEECIDARLQLASLLSRIGKTDEAVTEYKKMAEMLSKSGVIKNSANWGFLITTYEKIVDLEPDNYLARNWLADAYFEKGDRSKPLMHLRDIIGIFRRREEVERTIEPLQKIIEILPEEVDTYDELAQAFLVIEKKEEAIATYHQAAQICKGKENFPKTQSYFEKVLEISPWDLKAHKEIAGLLKRQNCIEESVEKYKDIARLCEGAGLYLEAISACEEIFRIMIDEYYTLKTMGRLYEKCEGRNGALENYVKFAFASLEKGNLEETKGALKKIRALEPTNVNIDRLEFEIRTRETLLAGGTPEKLPSASPQPLGDGPGETTIASAQTESDSNRREKTKVRKRDRKSGGTRIIKPTISIQTKPSSRQKKKKDPKSSNIQGQLAKIKGMMGEDGGGGSKPAPTPPPEGSEQKAGDPPSSSSNGGKVAGSMKKFADHLKALKSGGFTPEPASSSNSDDEDILEPLEEIEEPNN